MEERRTGPTHSEKIPVGSFRRPPPVHHGRKFLADRGIPEKILEKVGTDGGRRGTTGTRQGRHWGTGMASRHRRGGLLQDVRTLFDTGTTGGLTDGELLGRLADGPARDDAAGPAFAALMDRHGPMVLRVCRSILRDEHDAQDAFQATFLVLVRRADAVRRQESVGSWLHGVALRVAAHARAGMARRRRHERCAGELAVTADRSGAEGVSPELAAILQEELGRLPERYRAAFVLCYLEGHTCEAAAARLGWPVGTVKSRLARGRERLRGRLIRRGLVPDEASERVKEVPIGGLVACSVGTESAQAAGRCSESTRKGTPWTSPQPRHRRRPSSSPRRWRTPRSRRCSGSPPAGRSPAPSRRRRSPGPSRP